MSASRICPQCRTSTDDVVCPKDGFPTVEAAKYGNKSKVDPLIGTTFEERYRIERKLGQGGMGAVYKATQLAVDRSVALKVMNKELGDDLKEVARFQQEARAIAALHHPNIIGLIDFGQAKSGQLFLVMEYLEGEPLNHTLRREAPFDPKRAHRITTQVLEALAEAHERGIVHRDMKPENLFLTQLGRKGDFIKVLDFGIAKVRGEGGSNMTLTRTGAIIGSPRYMAPEQARGQTITGQTDLYAVGCILYEMLTGRPVFQAASATDYVIAHVTQPPPPLTVDGAELRGPLVDIAMWMLQKKPWDRPQGCEAVLRALEECRERPIITADDKDFKDDPTGPMADEAGLPSLPGLSALPGATQAASTDMFVDDGPADLDTSVSRQRSSIPGGVLDAGGPGGTEQVVPRRPVDKKPAWGLIAAAAVLVVGGGVAAAVLMGGGGDDAADSGKAQAAQVGNVTKDAPAEGAGDKTAPGDDDGAAQKKAARDNAASGEQPADDQKAAADKAAADKAAADDSAAAKKLAEEKAAAEAAAKKLAEEKAAAEAKLAAVKAAAEKAPEPVTLVTDKPGARVLRGDEVLGKTPFEINWPVSEDPPTLMVEGPRGYKDAEVELRVSQRGTKVDVTFERKPRTTKVKKKPTGSATKKTTKKKKGDGGWL